MKKRLLSILLAVVMLACMIPFTAVSSTAAETDAAETGYEAPVITMQPKDSYIRYTNWNETIAWYYPTLRVGARGGSGSYSYYWYQTDATGTTRIKLTNTYGLENPELKVVLYTPDNKDPHYYYCAVYDNETGLHTNTRVAKVSRGMGSQDVKYYIDGTKIKWFESDSYNGDPCTYYFLRLARHDATHGHIEYDRVVIKRNSENKPVMYNGLNQMYYTDVSCTCEYDAATRMYTLDLRYEIDDFEGDNNISYDILFGLSHDGDSYRWDDLHQSREHKVDDMLSGEAQEVVLGGSDGEVRITPTDCTIGDTLTAHINGGRWAGCTEPMVYEWVRYGSGQEVIQTSTSNTYKITAADIGKKIDVYVHPAKDGFWHDLPYFKAEGFRSWNYVTPGKKTILVSSTIDVTFTEPKAGAKADYTVNINDPDNGKYLTLETATIGGTGLTFMDTSANRILNPGQYIEGDTKYIAYVDMNIKPSSVYNYDFRYLKANFNGQPAKVDLSNSRFVSFSREYTTGALVKSAGATVTAPSVGSTPDKYPVSLEPDKYSVEYHYWYNVTDGRQMTSSDKFETGKNYYIYLTFKPVGNNSLSDETSYYVNGKKAALNSAGRYGNVRGYFNLGYSGPTEMLMQVNAQITVPAAGAHPDFVPVPSDPTRYSVVVERWYKSGDYSNPMTLSDTFEAGKTYYVRLKFRGNDGYKVDYESTLTLVNGERVTGGLYSYGNNSIGRAVAFKVAEAASYWIGDVNADGAVKNRDALILDRYIAGWKDYDKQIKNWDAADMNRDGQIKNRDALMLDRYIAGWKDYQKYVFQVNG